MDVQEKRPGSKNKGGRPTKKEGEKLTETVKIRLRSADLLYLREFYKQEGVIRKLSFQQYLRELLLSRPKNKQNSPKNINQLQAGVLILQFDTITKELKATRANHNQTVKKINALPLTRELKNQLQENYKLEQEILNLLNKLNTLFLTLQQILGGNDF